jgi:putative membrane protein
MRAWARLVCAIWAVAALVLLGARSAQAHRVDLPVGPDHVWHHWSLDPWITVPLALALWLYGRGVLRLWARAGRGRGISILRTASFVAGALVLALALVSPLDALGETLFTFHMVQHALLIVVVPPLLLFGLPGVAFAWAFPRRARRGAARASAPRSVVEHLTWMLHPLAAAGIHGLALWIWHVPAAFDAALENAALHILEHASFFLSALLFWQSLVLAHRSVATVPSAIAAAFLTLFHGGFLGALITFAPRPLFDWYGGRTELWGLDPLSDQQLAGLVMWIPLGFVYLAAGLTLAARLLAPSSGAKRAFGSE